MRKILLLIEQEWIAPRFDLCQEILIAQVHQGELVEPPRNILLGKSTAEKLFDFILKENCSELICGAIQESHYSFLQWKKIAVADFVVGQWQQILDQALLQPLPARSIFHPLKGFLHE